MTKKAGALLAVTRTVSAISEKAAKFIYEKKYIVSLFQAHD